jgi:uncharacterized protein YkwD
MREGLHPVIIPGMQSWIRSRTATRLCFLWVVTALLAVLIAGTAAAEESSTDYDGEELQFLQLMNDYRKDNGLKPLIFSDTLSVAAERHSRDMAEYSFFSHYTVASSHYREGSAPWDRMAAEGYGYNTYRGENIAVGYETAERAFEAWRNSPSHNAAMLDGKYRVIGVARINAPGSVHGWYWTTDFGAVVDPTSHAPGESPTDGESAPEPLEDGPGIENGQMNNDDVWEQEAEDEADLIVGGYAHLGDDDNGEDELRQKLQVGENTELSYEVKIETNEHRHPSDHLVVRLTDQKGEKLDVLKRYSDGDAGGWRRHTLDLSRFASRTVYLSFFVETDPVLRTTFYVDDVGVENGEGSKSGSQPGGRSPAPSGA